MMTDNTYTCMAQVQIIKELRADGGIMQFGLDCLSTYSTRQREFHWRLLGKESFIVLFHNINLVKVYKSQIYRVCLLSKMNAKYISSSAMKNQYFRECVARVYHLIFSPHDFISLYTARPSCEYYRQVYFVHSTLQDESLQITIYKLP